MSELDGVWIPQGGEFYGESIPVPEARFIINGLTYRVEHGETADVGFLRLAMDVSPSAMDVVGESGPNAGKTIAAIFRVRGNLLQLCYDISADGARPSAFGTDKASMRILVRYRRE